MLQREVHATIFKSSDSNNRDTGDVLKQFVGIWFKKNFIQSLQTTRDLYFAVKIFCYKDADWIKIITLSIGVAHIRVDNVEI